MPIDTKSSSIVSPSKAGGAPVIDVLQRIQVRDPNRKSTGEYHRRAEDFELHWPLSEAATLMVAAAVIAAGLVLLSPAKIPQSTSLQVRKPASETVIAKAKPTVPARTFKPRRDMELQVPRGIHPRPLLLNPMAGEETSVLLAPENVHVDFLEPRTMEVRWNSLGDGYRYVLYTAPSPALEEARPVLDQPVLSTSALWIPEDQIQAAWMAVKGIDPQGHETAFSRPVLVQLPPA